MLTMNTPSTSHGKTFFALIKQTSSKTFEVQKVQQLQAVNQHKRGWKQIDKRGFTAQLRGSKILSN